MHLPYFEFFLPKHCFHATRFLTDDSSVSEWRQPDHELQHLVLNLSSAMIHVSGVLGPPLGYECPCGLESNGHSLKNICHELSFISCYLKVSFFDMQAIVLARYVPMHMADIL
ncbi:hypothetical protein AVEN_149502-1 [Araneus ventricosus]|uniref:Uncharacterized protein n=1 Tax=Araneus ventricosus TaxID=182803 RepID=A0A4Y2QHK2_ARAVE|nr:hypothetical protein AVEN_149502-1 [Araneus ventricosus]